MSDPKRLTRQQAINLNCKQCIYDNAAPGTWRQQVDRRTCTDCPLFAYRPRSSTRLEAIPVVVES